MSDIKLRDDLTDLNSAIREAQQKIINAEIEFKNVLIGIDGLSKERDEKQELLRESEWAAMNAVCEPICWVCKGYKRDGHIFHCKLIKVLKEE